MATVTGMTAQKMLELAGEEIVSGAINGAGRLILTRRNGNQVDAGAATPPVGSATWPVGSIYMSVSPTNPGAQLGGTWVAWGSGRVPVGVDPGQTEFDSPEETGGSKTVTVTVANLPPHSHTINHDHTTPNLGFRYTATTATGGANALRVTDIDGVAGGGGSQGIATIDIPSYSGNSGNGSGTSTPITTLQPYITCYMWKRTA